LRQKYTAKSVQSFPYEQNQIKQGDCHTVALPLLTLKGILKAKEEL